MYIQTLQGRLLNCDNISEVKFKKDNRVKDAGTLMAYFETGGNKVNVPVFYTKGNIDTKIMAFIDGIKDRIDINLITYAGINAMCEAIDENVRLAKEMAENEAKDEEVEPIDHFVGKEKPIDHFVGKEKHQHQLDNDLMPCTSSPVPPAPMEDAKQTPVHELRTGNIDGGTEGGPDCATIPASDAGAFLGGDDEQ